MTGCSSPQPANLLSSRGANNIILSSYYNSVELEPNVRIAMDSFVKSANCPKCIFEIHINKVLPDSFLISLMAQGYHTTFNRYPLSICKIDSINFYVYSGIEDIFKSKSSFNSISLDTNIIINKIWSVALSGQKMAIDTFGSYAFFPATKANIILKKNHPHGR